MSQSKTSLNILITNDDGIHAEGLWALYRTLCKQHHVVVIAPDRERSAVGHGITLHHPLRAAEVTVNGGYRAWSVSGTPADCIKLAIAELLGHPPDMVISGINPGANVGVNLNYSGTVAAAKEAALNGLPAMAVSIQSAQAPHYDTAAQFVAHVAPLVHTKGLPKRTFLNINVPNLPIDQTAGVRVSRQGGEIYEECFEKRLDLRNRNYYWQANDSPPVYAHKDADGAVLEDNYISVTPVRCDMTDYDIIDQLKTWDFENGYRQEFKT